MLLQRYFRVTFEQDLNAVFDPGCYIASENGQKRPNFGGFLMPASVGQICAEGRLHRDFSYWRACIAEAVMPPVGYRIFIVQMAVQTLIKHYLIALPFRQSCSYDPRFRRPLKRTFRRTGILLLSKRKRYVRRTFRRTKTRKNLRSNRCLATENPAKTQKNSG